MTGRTPNVRHEPKRRFYPGIGRILKAEMPMMRERVGPPDRKRAGHGSEASGVMKGNVGFSARSRSSAPGFRRTTDWDIIFVLVQLERTLARLAAEYAAPGRAALFAMLEAAPMPEPHAETYAAIAGRLGMTEAAVQQAASRLRRRHRAAPRGGRRDPPRARRGGASRTRSAT